MPAIHYPSAIPGLDPINQGKTGDLFAAKAKVGPYADQELLAIVKTDRISTHNIVHESTVPEKGYVLTAMTVFWLEQLLKPAGVANHLVAYGSGIYDYLDVPADAPKDLHLRTIIVRKLKVIPVEFIFRSFLCGSLYREFYSKNKENPYGINLSPGLPLMHKFQAPEFTPTEKSKTDDPLPSQSVYYSYPDACVLAHRAYTATSDHLAARGITLLDGKYEVGIGAEGHPVLIDEVSTPDTCRFAKTSDVTEGQEPPYLDKEVARQAATQMWGGRGKGPLCFSDETIHKLTMTYLRVFVDVTGSLLGDFQRDVLK